MKIIKIILLIVWGLLTFGFFIMALIQRQDYLMTKEICAEQNELLHNSLEINKEYANNFKLLKNHSNKSFAIDSISNSSKFLKTINK